MAIKRNGAMSPKKKPTQKVNTEEVAKKYLTVDDVEDLQVYHPKTKVAKKDIMLRLPEDQVKYLKRYILDNDLDGTVQDIIRDLVDSYVDTLRKGNL